MKPYRPNNQIDKHGWRWLVLTSGIGGLTLGGFAFASSFVVYLVLVLPILMGLAGGKLLQRAVNRGKVRNPAIAGIFAVVTGVAIYGTMHTADYIVFRQNATKEINRALNTSARTNPQVAVDVDQFLQAKTGAKGFLGFMRYRSQAGIVVNRGALRIPVSANITWGYWGLEFLITSAIALGFATRAAKKPFCENCHSWYSASDRLGRVKHQDLPDFLEAIEKEAADSISRLIDPLAKIYPPSLELHLKYCADCQSSDGVLTLTQAIINKYSEIKFIPYRQGIISPTLAIATARAVRDSLYLSVETLAEQQNPGQSQIFEQVAFAQQERSHINLKVNSKTPITALYANHNLSEIEIANLHQQLASYGEIKKAYLVQKIVQNLPENPFYLLGIIRKKQLLESVTAQTEWESEVGNELEFPGTFIVIVLNHNRKLQKQLQQVEGAEIYPESLPELANLANLAKSDAPELS